jgi:bla regulator protein blaR1
MDTFYQIASGQWIYALGWTVVHSLWQGALLACMLSAFRWFTARSRPQTRYWAGLVALLALFLASAFTFAYLLAPENVAEGAVISLSGIAGAAEAPSLLGRATGALNSNLPLLVAAWALGLAFFVLRTLGGYWYLSRLRRSGQAPGDERWQRRLDEIAASMGVRGKVGLMESARVFVPVVIGFLKPVVLLPVGLLNQLSMEEAEAVLAHELAHIRRWDYLVNLLQSFLETLYYFNPAAWYISTTVRNERENCCDDLAVAWCGSPLAYAYALVRIQEREPQTPLFALSMAGNGKPLLKRVKRILNQPNHKKTIMERFSATLLLLAAVALFSLSAGQPDGIESGGAVFPVFAAVDGANDSIPPPVVNRQRIVKEEGDRRLELTTENGAVVEYKVDGKVIPQEQLGDYQREIDALQASVKIPPPPPPPAPGAPGAPAPPPPPPAPGKIEKEIIIRKERNDDRKVMIWTDENDADRKKIIVELDEIRTGEDPRIMFFKEREGEMQFRIQGMEEEMKKREFAIFDLERARAPRPDVRPFVWQEGGGDLKSNIERELRRDGYIPPSGSYSFELSGKKLVINGKKESEAIFGKYRRIYERHTGLNLSKDTKISIKN